MTSSNNTRTERDSMGEMEVPAEAYYGASTQRAVLNFPISSLRFSRAFNRGLAQIKQVAAQVNMDLGSLDKEVGNAIVTAAQDVIDGNLEDHFVVDPGREIEQHDPQHPEDHETDDIVEHVEGGGPGHHASQDDHQAQIVARDGERHGQVVLLDELRPEHEAPVQPVVDQLPDDEQDENNSQVGEAP